MSTVDLVGYQENSQCGHHDTLQYSESAHVVSVSAGQQWQGPDARLEDCARAGGVAMSPWPPANVSYACICFDSAWHMAFSMARASGTSTTHAHFWRTMLTLWAKACVSEPLLSVPAGSYPTRARPLQLMYGLYL